MDDASKPKPKHRAIVIRITDEDGQLVAPTLDALRSMTSLAATLLGVPEKRLGVGESDVRRGWRFVVMGEKGATHAI